MDESYCICGLSTFSFRAAVSLRAAGNEVIAVDRDPEVIARIRDDVTQAVCADLRDRLVLRDIGALDCGVAIVSLPKDFDIAILTTHFFHEEGMPRIVAQVNSEEEEAAIRVVGATEVVFPERDAADRIVRKLTLPGLVDHFPLTQDAGILEATCPDAFARKTILDLQIRTRYGVSVVGIKKKSSEPGAEDSEHMIIAPPATTVLAAGDLIVVLGTTESLSRFAKALAKRS
ncbi:MAG: TrkA family potassium uptake protein [Planctomycetes bacterium]|nr:TrkA family potassium uptake protein [Planctomycetota bacterium]